MNVAEGNTVFNFTNNNISRIDTSIYLDGNNKDRITEINLMNNPIDCSCNNYEFVKDYPEFVGLYFQNYDKLMCHGEKDITVNLLHENIKSVYCSLNNQTSEFRCGDGCECFWHPLSQDFFMNCSQRNLTQVPTFVAPHKFKFLNTTYDV